jgi:hypothetical protein
MVEAWENWHNFYITPKNITRVEIRGLATLLATTLQLHRIITNDNVGDARFCADAEQ